MATEETDALASPSMAQGIPTEASILGLVERAMPGRVRNVYAASCGGGKFMAVLQFRKEGSVVAIQIR